MTDLSRWLWWDLNLRPWAYESPALTTELQSLNLLLLYPNYNIILNKENSEKRFLENISKFLMKD